MAVAIEVTIPQPEYEFARGDNIILPCSFTSTADKKSGVVTWTVEGEQGKEVNVSMNMCGIHK